MNVRHKWSPVILPRSGYHSLKSLDKLSLETFFFVDAVAVVVFVADVLAGFELYLTTKLVFGRDKRTLAARNSIPANGFFFFFIYVLLLLLYPIASINTGVCVCLCVYACTHTPSLRFPTQLYDATACTGKRTFAKIQVGGRIRNVNFVIEKEEEEGICSDHIRVIICG